tara:strand:- start:135 stop:1250 length:1116 start_codon:yes stop_codon:yes gene_type:complete
MSFIKGKNDLVDRVIKDSNQYHLQFILTTIKKDSGAVKKNQLKYLTGDYFYPASMVKLPTAILTYELIDSLGLNSASYIKMNADENCKNQYFTKTTQNKKLRFTNIIEELLAISDNNYYSILFHALGADKINKKLNEYDLKNTFIYTSFNGCPNESDLIFNSYSIYNENDNIVFSQPKRKLDSIDYLDHRKLNKRKLCGEAHYKNGKKIDKPKNFNYALEYSLVDINETMIKLFYPGLYSKGKQFKISELSRKELFNSLLIYPEKIRNKKYHNISKYPKNYYKYSIIGDKEGLKLNDQFNIYSKIGISYGFVTETAYILDKKNKQDFFITISIKANRNNIMGDGIYQYESIARPFIASFTRLINSYLLSKK